MDATGRQRTRGQLGGQTDVPRPPSKPTTGSSRDIPNCSEKACRGTGNHELCNGQSRDEKERRRGTHLDREVDRGWRRVLKFASTGGGLGGLILFSVDGKWISKSDKKAKRFGTGAA